jgi:hypothetical protein
MAIALILEFADLDAGDYDAVMKELGLYGGRGTWPDGIVSHLAGATADGWRVVDVWQSQAHFDKFFAARLKPAFDKIGLPAPLMTPVDVHFAFHHG